MDYIAFQSTYSLLQSTISIDRMIKYAKAEQIQHLLLADKNVLFGAIEFYQKAKASNLIPHIGMRLDIGDLQALLIARNNDGLKALQLISSHINGFDYTFDSAETVLRPLCDMLIVLDRFDEAVIELLQAKKNCAVFLQKTAKGDKEQAQNLPCVDLAVCNGLVENDLKMLQTLTAIDKNMKCQEISGFPSLILPKQREEALPEAFLQALVHYQFGVYQLPAYSPDPVANQRLFEQLCQKGLQKRYGATITETHVERLQYEMSIIKEMGFVDYFLIIWDVMRFARKADIIIGPGRGSAVGSLVAYVLGITKIDPLRYNLLFERFLNTQRQSMPDIDLDVEDQRRGEIIAYLREKHGYDHVAHILTFGTFGAKSAIRDVSKAWNHKQEEINVLLKHITSSTQSIAENIAASPALAKIIKTHPALAQIIEAAQVIEGFPRHSSIHAAGIVLTDAPIADTIATIEPEPHMLVTQATMVYCEDIGLLKIDFLGLRNLTIIREVSQQVMEGGTILDFIEKAIPEHDPATFEMLSRGETTGLFQLESDGMRQLLRKFKVQQFFDIAVVLALYRPGPMQFIDEYIARKDKKKPYHIQLAVVEPILRETHGIMIYQEQVMQIAQAVGGMSLADADNFRRAMSKKDYALLEQQRTKFLAGAKAKGLDEQAVAALFEEIMAFASYGFNKSHAIAYAIIAYQMAYLKVHYPAVFISGLLNSVIHNETKSFQYLQMAIRFGLKILPVDINKSGALYTVEDDNIRIGLSAVKSVGKITVEHILSLRKEKPFSDLADFITRTESKIVNIAVLEQLTNAYGFSMFSKNQKAIHAYLKTHEAGRKFQGNAFQLEATIPQDVTDYTLEERREIEQKAYGFTLFAHPLLHYPKNAHSLRHPPKNYLSYIVYIDRLQEITTRKGDKMAFATLSDMHEAIETVIFPSTYQKYGIFLRPNAIVKVTIQLPKASEGPKAKLHVSKVEPVMPSTKEDREIR